MRIFLISMALAVLTACSYVSERTKSICEGAEQAAEQCVVQGGEFCDAAKEQIKECAEATANDEELREKFREAILAAIGRMVGGVIGAASVGEDQQRANDLSEYTTQTME